MNEAGHVSTVSVAEDRIEQPSIAKAALIESKKLWLLSGPSIIVVIFNFLLSAVSQMFPGHLGESDLAGASIANIGIQGIALGVLNFFFGILGSWEWQAQFRLCVGKQYSTLGLTCQRSMIIMTAVSVLLSFLYGFSEPALHAMGQTRAIAEKGGIFAKGLIPQIFALALSNSLQRFLMAQNIVTPVAYMSVATFVLHVLLSWVTVYKLGWGLLGVSLTLSLSWWILTIATFLYVLWTPRCKDTWNGFSLEAFTGLWPFFKFTVASAFMLCLEIWYNQSLVLISRLLPNPQVTLDSLSICMNYWTWDFQLIMGISPAVCVRVGNELGAKRPKTARFSVVVAGCTCFLISVILGIGVLALKKQLSQAFTSSNDVIKAVSAMTPLLAISVLLNGIQPVLSNVAIGCGWQYFVAYVNLASFYIVGLPIGVVLGFKANLGAKGIWWGMISGLGLQTTILIIFTARANWQKEVEVTVDRVKRSSNAPEQSHQLHELASQA